jgi:peptidyl-dipeptidase A
MTAVPGCSASSRGADRNGPGGGDATAQFQALRAAHIERFQELEAQWNLAWWEAELSGDAEDFQRSQELEIAVRRLHSDRETFETLRRLRESGQITDPTLQRSLETLYLAFEENQIDDALMQRIVALQTELEQTFNTFRPVVDGEEVTANQIREVLGDSDDSARRRVMWDASKEVGTRLAERLVELARLRNQAARALGYDDYYVMMLHFREQDPAEVQGVFDELAEMTDEPFRQAKAELDARLAERFGIPVADLRPWHYADPFFQESPGEGIDLDPLFASDDPQHIVAISTRFYEGIGLPVVSEILARSDLFEREGKVEHAFCTHIDRRGDVRVLTNLRNNEQWMGTLMHELGHGVYDAYLDQDVLYELREPAHTFTTEGVAELFGTLTRDPAWLRSNLTIPADAPQDLDDLVRAEHRMDLLIFARWSLVMVNFERQFYADPEQDLEDLWWDVVERYQGLHRPDSLEGRADFATKIHLVVAPVYYHNYMLGRMYAAQLRHRLSEEVPATMDGGTFDMTGHPEVGAYLIEHVFQPGAQHTWQEFVRQSTGEDLTARYFAEAIR